MAYETLISEIPILECFAVRGKFNIAAPQKFQPNMFKSHLEYDQIPKGNAKHIIVVR